MLLEKHPWKDSILFHHTIILLTPVFSSKILIPPKETVKKTFCLCSPFERAAATIPYWNKEQFGSFHHTSKCHSRAQRFTCGWFTTFIGKLKGFPGRIPLLLLPSSPFSRYHISLPYPGSISNMLLLATPALANPPWNLFSWKLKVISSTLSPAISCFFFPLSPSLPPRSPRKEPNKQWRSLLHRYMYPE